MRLMLSLREIRQRRRYQNDGRCISELFKEDRIVVEEPVVEDGENEEGHAWDDVFRREETADYLAE